MRDENATSLTRNLGNISRLPLADFSRLTGFCLHAGPVRFPDNSTAEKIPILADEAPNVEAVKNNSSLSGMQKMQQLRAIHQQTDPQMKAILSPDQYQKLQAIRQQAIREAMQKRRG